MTTITVSYLQSVYTHPESGRCLHRSKITDFGVYETFAEFVADFLTAATMPRPATNKSDAYGWTPTLFEPCSDDRDATVIAKRQGRFAAPEVTLFVADLDNHHADRTMVTIDAVESVMTKLGLSYLLYTSYSHTPARHKVRIVCPISRDMTPDEAFKVHLWFTAALDRQLDGSIYDPGDFLYGPPIGSDVRQNCDGAALDVDAYLALHDQLAEDDRTWLTRSASGIHRPITPDVEAKAAVMAANTIVTTGVTVTITNPVIFNPAWFELLDRRYQGGSRSRTLRGLIAKVWVRSSGSLTLGDLWSLYRELDAHYHGYCLSTYGRAACERDIKSAMTAVGSGPALEFAPAATTTDTLKATLIAKEHARLLKRRA